MLFIDYTFYLYFPIPSLLKVKRQAQVLLTLHGIFSLSKSKPTHYQNQEYCHHFLDFPYSQVSQLTPKPSYHQAEPTHDHTNALPNQIPTKPIHYEVRKSSYPFPSSPLSIPLLHSLPLPRLRYFSLISLIFQSACFRFRFRV